MRRLASLLLALVLIDYEIVHQLLPFVRLDGYWFLADLTGIPDFFSQMGAFLRSLLPSWVPLPRGRTLPPLKWWAKLFFIAYIVITVPLLAFLLFLMVRAFPRVLATGFDALRLYGDRAADAVRDGNVLGGLGNLGQLALIGLPTLALAYTLYMLARRLGGAKC